MATKKTGTTFVVVDALKHSDDKRKNIPTAEYQSLMADEARKPVQVREALNTALKKDWQDWQVPREADAKWSDKAKKLIKFLQDELGVRKIRFPETSGIGVKPVSIEGTERLVRKAIQYAIDNDKPSVTIVHKGNIMKFTEGGFRDWSYALAQKEFGAVEIDGGPWCKFKNPKTGKEITVKDSIADAFEKVFQIWQTSTQVTNVMGFGPVPTFAPPVVPMGPVVGGLGTMMPGGLV